MEGGSKVPGIVVQILVPDLHVQKRLVMNPKHTALEAKKVILDHLKQNLPKDVINYGLYMPPGSGKPGKFLDETRLLSDYAPQGKVFVLKLRYKQRDYSRGSYSDKTLSKANSKVNQKKFIESIQSRAMKKIEKLLEQGLDPNFIAEDGNTPLGVCCGRDSHMECILPLMSLGAHTDFRGKDGLTPVHRAAIGGNTQALKMLLSLGASPNCRDGKGLTPLYHASIMGDDVSVCDTLLRYRSDMGIRDYGGWTELHQVAKHGHIHLVDTLLLYGADINAQNNMGNTPLHVAASHNQGKVAQLLMTRGCNTKKINFSSQPPNQVALLCGNHQIAKNIVSFDETEIKLVSGMPAYNPKARGSQSSVQAGVSSGMHLSASVPVIQDNPGLTTSSPPAGIGRSAEMVGQRNKADTREPDDLSESQSSESQHSQSPSLSSSKAKKSHRYSRSRGHMSSSSSTPSTSSPPSTQSPTVPTQFFPSLPAHPSPISRVRLYPCTPGRKFVATKNIESSRAGDLSLRKGMEVEVLYIGKGGYWEGRAGGRQGWFPQDAIEAVSHDVEAAKDARVLPERTVSVTSTDNKSRQESLKEKSSRSGIRVVHLQKGPKGFGFSMRGVRSISGGSFRPSPSVPALQYVAVVESGSTAADAGLKPGDFIIEVNNNNTTCSTHDEVVNFIKKSNSRGLTLKLIRPSKLPPGIQESPSIENSPNNSISKRSTSLADRQPEQLKQESAFEGANDSPILQRVSNTSGWDSSQEEQNVEEEGTRSYPVNEPLKVGNFPPSIPNAIAQSSGSSQSKSADRQITSSLQPPHSEPPHSVQDSSLTVISPQHPTTTASQLTVFEKMPSPLEDAKSSEYDRVAQKLQSRKISQPAQMKSPSLDTSSDDEDEHLSMFAKALRNASLQRKARMLQNKPRLTKAVESPTSPQSSTSIEAGLTEGLDSPSTNRIASVLPQQIEPVVLTHDDTAPLLAQHGQSDMEPPSPESAPKIQQDLTFEGDKFKDTAKFPGELEFNDGIEDGETRDDAQESLDNLKSRSHVLYLNKGTQGFGFGLRGVSSTVGVSFRPSLEVPALQYVATVDSNSPADQVGLKVGDFLIEVDGVDTTFSNHNEVVGLVKRCQRVLKMKVIRTSRQPQSVEESLQRSLVEEEPSNTEQSMSSPLLGQSWQQDRETITRAAASDVPIKQTLTDLQQASSQKNGYVEEELATTSSLSFPAKGNESYPLMTHQEIASMPPYLKSMDGNNGKDQRKVPTMGFTSDIGASKAQKKRKRSLEKQKEMNPNSYDIVAQKMQSRKLSQPLKPSASDAHDSSEVNMSEFARALKRASLQRETRMMQNSPRLTEIAELPLSKSGEEFESPSTTMLTSALLQKIESVTKLDEELLSPAQPDRYSDTNSWSDAESPSPKMERVFRQESEFSTEERKKVEVLSGMKQQGHLSVANGNKVKGANEDEEDPPSPPLDANSDKEDKKNFGTFVINLKRGDCGYGFIMEEVESANKGSFVPTTQVPSHLYVSSVDSNGPAGQAGIKVGDYVLKIDDTIVTQRSCTEMDQLVTGSQQNLTMEVARPSESPSDLDMCMTKTKNDSQNGAVPITQQLQQTMEEEIKSERHNESPNIPPMESTTPKKLAPPPVKPKPSRMHSRTSLSSSSPITLVPINDSNGMPDKQATQENPNVQLLTNSSALHQLQPSDYNVQLLTPTGVDRKPHPKSSSHDSIDMTESIPVHRLKDKFENLAKLVQSHVPSRQVRMGARAQWSRYEKKGDLESGPESSTPTMTPEGKYPNAAQAPNQYQILPSPLENNDSLPQKPASDSEISSDGSVTEYNILPPPLLDYSNDNQSPMPSRQLKEEAAVPVIGVQLVQYEKNGTSESAPDSSTHTIFHEEDRPSAVQAPKQYQSMPTPLEGDESLPQKPSDDGSVSSKGSVTEYNILPPPLPDHPNDNRMSYIDPFDFDVPPPMDFEPQEAPTESFNAADEACPEILPPVLRSPSPSCSDSYDSSLPVGVAISIKKGGQDSPSTEEGETDQELNAAAELPPDVPFMDDASDNLMNAAAFQLLTEGILEEPIITTRHQDLVLTSDEEGDLLDSIVNQLMMLTGQETKEREGEESDEPPPLPSCPPPGLTKSASSTSELDLVPLLEDSSSPSTQFVPADEPQYTATTGYTDTLHPALQPKAENGFLSTDVHFVPSSKSQDLSLYSPASSEYSTPLCSRETFTSELLEMPTIDVDRGASRVHEMTIHPACLDDTLDLLPPPMDDDTEESEPPFSLPPPFLPDQLLDDEELTPPSDDPVTDQTILPPPILTSDDSDTELEKIDSPSLNFLPPPLALSDTDSDEDEEPEIHFLLPPVAELTDEYPLPMAELSDEHPLPMVEDSSLVIPPPVGFPPSQDDNGMSPEHLEAEVLGPFPTTISQVQDQSGSSQGTGVNNSEVLSKRERITAKVSIGYKSKPVSKWDTSDVCTWLSDVGLGAHCQVFAENEIMGEHLFDLSREELRDLGISKIGHQKTFRQKLELAINSNND